MPRHIAQSTVANPIDYNRAQIRGLVSLMQNMQEAIAIAPENFAVVDLMVLFDAAANLTTDMGNVPSVSQFTEEWTHHAS